MSFNGIRQFAAVFRMMGDTRHALLGGDYQDARLAQLMAEAEDCVKDNFAEETIEAVTPDMKTIGLSMRAIQEGRTQPIQEIIDDLEGECWNRT